MTTDNNIFTMRVPNMRICEYLPGVIREHIEKTCIKTLPEIMTYEAVTMFADVSGFTAMSGALAAKGPTGAECLGKYLNSYFEQMLRLISSAGIYYMIYECILI